MMSVSFAVGCYVDQLGIRSILKRPLQPLEEILSG
jgi:hypothetical protein